MHNTILILSYLFILQVSGFVRYYIKSQVYIYEYIPVNDIVRFPTS